MTTAIEVINGIKIFEESQTKAKIPALSGIDLLVKKGELVSVIGPSGAGKTTLLRIISGIENLSSGELFIGNIPLHNMTSTKRKEFRKRYIGTFTQFGRQNFDPKMTVEESMIWEATNAGFDLQTSKNETKRLLAKLDILHLKDQKNGMLSAGEAMRVSFLKAAVKKPLIILADEPTGQLDTENMQELYKVMRELLSEDMAILVVTHDIRFQSISDRSLLIMDGRLASQHEKTSLLQQRSTYFGSLEEEEIIKSQLFVDSNNFIRLPFGIVKRLRIGKMVEISHKKGEQTVSLRVLDESKAFDDEEEEIIKNFSGKSMDSQEKIIISNLYKSYISEKFVLNNLDLTVKKGEFVVLLGPSGSGKTTLLNIIAKLDRATKGDLSVLHDRSDTSHQKKEMKTEEFSYLTQNYTGHPYLTVKDNAMLPNILKSEHIDDIKYDTMKKRLELSSFENRYPHELSGGQLQRASLLSTLLKKSSLLLADEPTANLNTELAVKIMNLLIERAETGDTLLIATHDYTMVRPGFRVLRILNGSIIEDTLADDKYCMDLQKQYLAN